LLEADVVVLALQEVEVGEDHILELEFVEVEDLEQDVMDLVQLEHLVLVVVVSEEDGAQLVDD